MIAPLLISCLLHHSTVENIDTNCVFTAPFVESFEGSSWQFGSVISQNPGQLDSCWSRSTTTGFYWTPFIGSTSGTWTGPDFGVGGVGKYLYTSPTNTITTSTSLITPHFYTQPVDTLAMTFFTHIYDDFNEFQSLNVEADTGAGWFNLKTYTSGTQTAKNSPWDARIIYLNSFRSDTMQFRFTVNRNVGGFLKVGFDSFALKDTTCPVNATVYSYSGTGLSRTYSIINPKTNYKYQWFFGDGNSAFGPSASHTFALSGNYTLFLVTTSDCGRVDSTQSNFQICGPSNPAISSVLLGDTATFTATGTDISSYYWSFGDGTFSTSPNPTHIYSSSGSFIVQLTTTNLCGESSVAFDTISLCSALVPEFTAQIISTNGQGMTVQFNANLSQGSVKTYDWAFGDNSFGSGVSPLKTYVIPGLNYNVTLTIEDSCGAVEFIQKSLNQLSTIEQSKSKWLVYPNPARDIIYLETSEQRQIDLIQLSEIQGKVIRSQAVQQSGIAAFSLEGVPTGVYRLDVIMKNEIWNVPILVIP